MSDLLQVRSAPGARRKAKRVGRGVGSNRGSTCGRGDKGQNSRSGGGVRAGFEGGQMPLQRRLPKRGFTPHLSSSTAEVRLSELPKLAGETIDLERLKKHRVVPRNAQQAKVIMSGTLNEAVNLKGIKVTASARVAIEAAKGNIEE